VGVEGDSCVGVEGDSCVGVEGDSCVGVEGDSGIVKILVVGKLHFLLVFLLVCRHR
jgi:hypothetical protein